MADTVTFKEDGTYTRTSEIQRINVESDPNSVVSSNPHIAKNQAAPPLATSGRSKPGSFSLADLRRAAGKAANTVAKTVIPQKDIDKLQPIETETRDFQPHPSDSQSEAHTIEKVNGVTGAEEVATTDQSAKASTVKKVDAQKRTTRKKRSKEALTDSESVKSVVTPDSPGETTSDVPTDTPAPEVHTVQVASDASSEDLHKAVSDMGGVKTASSIPDISLDTTQPAGAEDSEVRANSEDKAESKLPSVAADTATITAVHSGKGFTITTFSNFITQLNLDESLFARWCCSCIAASSRYSGILFYPSFNSDIRFYTYIAEKDMVHAVVVVGCGDSLTIFQLDTKTFKALDVSANATVEGEIVKFAGDVVVVYEERLHNARRM